MQADPDAVVDAILVTLLDEPATGYELKKWFNVGVVIARSARLPVEKDLRE